MQKVEVDNDKLRLEKNTGYRKYFKEDVCVVSHFHSFEIHWCDVIMCDTNFRPRYDVKTWMKKVVSHVMTSIV